ncbi:MAG: M60 family metallopeptidase [Armatimonadota bacterium]
MSSGYIRRASVAAMLLAAIATGACADSADVGAICEGVSTIDAPGLPGPVAAFGLDAFAVVTGDADGVPLPIVAATRLGGGRAVALGKDSFLDPAALEMGQTGRLLVNAIRWAAGSDDPTVGVFRHENLLEPLRERGLTAVQTDLRDLLGLDVVVLTPDQAPAELIDELAGFVADGGGLVAGFLGWGWLQLNPGKTLAEDSLTNRLLAPMGIVWLDGSLARTCDEGYAVGEPPSPLTNASSALDAVLAYEAGERELGEEQRAAAGALLSRTLDALPPNDELLRPRIAEAVADRRGRIVPTAEDPVVAAEVLDRLALTWDVEEAMRRPADAVTAHPAAAAYPGAVPDHAPRVSRSFAVDTGVHGWCSTGLYAAPGDVIRVELPDEVADGSLGVRIGSSTDHLWHKNSWKRAPEVSRAWPLDSSEVKAASAFGGLIYITVPRGCSHGTAPVTVHNVVEAPFFVLGATDLGQWRSELRKLPAPRAELATSKVILTVPSDVVRDLEDPRQLMMLWDRIMDLYADLAAYPSHRRERPLRYCADVQISAGWMHAGYPIMIPLQTAARLVDARHLAAEGDWGFWHEMGHMHQAPEWTFGGTGEVTVNLFTLYIFDRVCGKDPGSSHQNLSGERMSEKMREYFAQGAPFERWKRDPFLALKMYVQLQQAFGWEAFREVFAEYRDLPDDERPRSDDEKRDQWLVRFSRHVGRDLGPFFEAWGVPTSEQARASIADLPAWLPDDFPPEAEATQG